MKRKAAKRTALRRAHRSRGSAEHYLVVVRGWMFVVAFALMLGLGAVVGGYVNQQLNAGEVAGVSVEAEY